MPRATCRPRAEPSRVAVGDPGQRPGPVSRRSVAWDEGGKNRVANAAAEPAATTHRPGPLRGDHHGVAAEDAHGLGELNKEVAGEGRRGEAGQAGNPAGRLPAPGKLVDAGGGDERSGRGEDLPVDPPDAGDLHQAGEGLHPGQEGTGEDNRARGHRGEPGRGAPAAGPLSPRAGLDAGGRLGLRESLSSEDHDGWPSVSGHPARHAIGDDGGSWRSPVTAETPVTGD